MPDDPYGGPPQQWQHNVPPPADHAVTVFPKPSPPPGTASRPPHSPVQVPTPPPPPQPPFVSSSGGSGSNYSGSDNPLPPPSPSIALGFSKSTFTYEELVMATDGFSNANLLGQGGFGYVHRGVLPNGKEVAVKQLKAGSGQGEREFQAEVEIISRVHHKHLVTLAGYCITGSHRLLVYEFVPNNTLEFHLHGNLDYYYCTILIFILIGSHVRMKSVLLLCYISSSWAIMNNCPFLVLWFNAKILKFIVNSIFIQHHIDVLKALMLPYMMFDVLLINCT